MKPICEFAWLLQEDASDANKVYERIRNDQ